MAAIPRSRTKPRTLVAAAGLSLVLALPSGSALAADAESDASLCETISFEQLEALGPVQFETVLFDSDVLCAIGPSAGGTPVLSMVVTGLTLDSMIEALSDVTETSVGDHRAAIADGAVHVDIDDAILTVQLDVGPGGVEGIDPIEYATAVAGIVVTALDAAPPTDGETAGTSTSTLVGPPEVEGIEWAQNQEILSAQQMIERDEGQATIWQPMLDATGADASELYLLSVNARDDSGSIIGNYAALQILGTDEASLRTAVLELISTASAGEEARLEDLSLGGKDVQRLFAGDELRGYLYIDGDIAHTTTLSEEDSARVFEALP